MSALRRLRNFWIPWVAVIVLGCFSNAVAQTNYKITDLGTNKSTDNYSMAMGLNSEGWTENMDGFVNPPENSVFTTVARGRLETPGPTVGLTGAGSTTSGKPLASPKQRN
jgi:hypothetical protein